VGALLGDPTRPEAVDEDSLPVIRRDRVTHVLDGQAAPPSVAHAHIIALVTLTAPLGDGPDKGIYYDAHPIEQMSYHLTMLAYDMNGEPLSFGHGAPLRLRNETQLGFKQVKWIKGVEFVAHYSEIGGGYGGYNQDHEFFGYRQSI
jgi:DMSO/TMAO reductase YedYZ molybdopterin-dependent catalytic subunit